jgi:hypothetical protein
MPRTAFHSRRTRTSSSLIALATVLVVGASPAAAQSFNGTGAFVNPANGTINQSVANVTTVTINSGVQQAVINWTPTDNALTGGNIVFQNAGTTANFNGSNDFAVLNNINTASLSRVVELRGTINSRVGGVQGGNVYFYAPGGFLATSTSVFSVGSLVMSALPIATSGSTFITGFDTTNTVGFGQAPTANASITMNGTVNATKFGFGFDPPGSSYVALVAPRVVHNGTISTNGSAALVAAEAATISFSPDGLFDIQVTAGSTDSQGVNVQGDITGPTPTGADDKQGIYLVAVPKNQLMTMVIGNGSDLGFTLANSALDDHGVIVLSAGHDVTDGAIAAKSAAAGTGTADFWFTGAHATNNLIGEATGSAFLYSIADQPTTIFNNDVTVHADGSIFMDADGAGTSLTIGGDLSLSTNKTGTAGQSVLAGDISLYALNGGNLSVAGGTTLSANGTGGSAGSGGAGSGTGGNILVSSEIGSTLALHALTATATGTGGNGLAPGVNAGNGTGGTLRLYADDAATATILGAVSLDAKGTGGNASGAGLAGNGKGGNAYVYIGDNTTLTINGATSLKSDGQGGSHTTGNGGSGTGGESRITAVDPSTTGGLLTFNGNLTLSSDGTGGASGGAGTGGVGAGGWARISTPMDHDIDINGTLDMHAKGTGGNSTGGTGGAGNGGTVQIAGILGNIDATGFSANLNSDGTGGNGVTGGQGQGGVSELTSQSNVMAGVADLRARGIGGNGTTSGAGLGGTVRVQANGGDISLTRLNAYTSAWGGNASATAGLGHGGSVYIDAFADSSLSILNGMDISAIGDGGAVTAGGTGGDGIGGYIEVKAQGANALLTSGDPKSGV